MSRESKNMHFMMKPVRMSLNCNISRNTNISCDFCIYIIRYDIPVNHLCFPNMCLLLVCMSTIQLLHVEHISYRRRDYSILANHCEYFHNITNTHFF